MDCSCKPKAFKILRVGAASLCLVVAFGARAWASVAASFVAASNRGLVDETSRRL